MKHLTALIIILSLILSPAFSLTVPSYAPQSAEQIPICGGGYTESEEEAFWLTDLVGSLVIGAFFVGMVYAPQTLNDDDPENDIYAYIALTPLALVMIAAGCSKT